MKPPTEPSETFQWELEVPLLTNRFILYDLVKIVSLTGLLLFLLLSIVSLAANRKMTLDALAAWGQLTALATLGLAFLLALIMLLFFLNRFPMRFTLSPRGAQVVSLSRVGKWGNRLAVVLGALSGRPQVAGAGLLGMAQEEVFLRWEEVCRLNLHPRARVISLRNSWRLVFRLYCTPENCSPVQAAVRRWAGQARRPQESASPPFEACTLAAPTGSIRSHLDRGFISGGPPPGSACSLESGGDPDSSAGRLAPESEPPGRRPDPIPGGRSSGCLSQPGSGDPPDLSGIGLPQICGQSGGKVG